MRTGAASRSLAVHSTHLPAGKMDEEHRARVQGAVNILMGVTHESVARCLGAWTEADGRLCAVEEYGIRGDLFTEMYSERWALCTCAEGGGTTPERWEALCTGLCRRQHSPHLGGAGLGNWHLKMFCLRGHPMARCAAGSRPLGERWLLCWCGAQ